MSTSRGPRALRKSTILAVTLWLLGGVESAARVRGNPLDDSSVARAQVDAGVADLLGASDHLGVDWAALYAADVRGRGGPDFVDLFGGLEAIVLEDVVSAGVAVDMSALDGAETLADSMVYNGVVAPEHDLGTAYVYATRDSGGDLVIYVGVERLDAVADSTLELELNQDRVRVTTGAPWPIRGERVTDDLLVRLDVVHGVVVSAEVKRWVAEAGAFETLATEGGLATSACNGEPMLLLFCAGRVPVDATSEVWDAEGRPLEAISPDSFLEIGVNVGRLVGAVELTALQIRTPEDIILGTFRSMGYWGGRSSDRR
ncbi:MAG: hypothetical protein V3T72_05055 [Thermoanaerobaculia bacterium]